jgi:hypothetical protein
VRPEPVTKPTDNEKSLWLVIGGVVGFVLLVSYCSGDSGPSNVAEIMNTSNAEMGNAIAAQEPSPVEPLNAAGIRQGVAHLRLAFSAEGFSGAMIYSQNCFDALTRDFSWSKLDQCGAADMLVSRSIDSVDATERAGEAAYFESEAAAGRYLAAATGAGEPAAQADTRLNDLQAKVAGMRALVAVASPDSEASPKVEESEGDNSQVGEEVPTDANWLDQAVNRSAATSEGGE